MLLRMLPRVALDVAAARRADVVHAVAVDLRILAVVITVDADARAAAAGAGHARGDVVHVVAQDAVERAAAVDADGPAHAGVARLQAAVDLETLDVDVAGAVVPAGLAVGGRRRHDARAPAPGRAEHDARVGQAVDRRTEAALVDAGQDVDHRARGDQLRRARERAQRGGARAGIAVQSLGRDEQLGRHHLRRDADRMVVLDGAGGQRQRQGEHQRYQQQHAEQRAQLGMSAKAEEKKVVHAHVGCMDGSSPSVPDRPAPGVACLNLALVMAQSLRAQARIASSPNQENFLTD
jgi:hypothetical protein